MKRLIKSLKMLKLCMWN